MIRPPDPPELDLLKKESEIKSKCNKSCEVCEKKDFCEDKFEIDLLKKAMDIFPKYIWC